MGDKTDYVLQYRNLHLYLPLRMKLTKIHKLLKFKQSDWMKKYIDFKTEKRKSAANSFEKKIFKFIIIVSMVKQWNVYECQTSKQ